MNKWFDEDYAKQLSLENKFDELFAYCQKCADMQTADKMVKLAMSYSTALSERAASQWIEKSLPDTSVVAQLHDIGRGIELADTATITSPAVLSEINHAEINGDIPQAAAKPEYSFQDTELNHIQSSIEPHIIQNSVEVIEPSDAPLSEAYLSNDILADSNEELAVKMLQKAMLQEALEETQNSISTSDSISTFRVHKKVVKVVAVNKQYGLTAAYSTNISPNKKRHDTHRQRRIISEQTISRTQQDVSLNITKAEETISDKDLLITELKRKISSLENDVSTLKDDKRFLQQSIDARLADIDATVKDTNLTAHENNSMLRDISTYIRSEMPSRLAELHKAVAESGLSPDDERFDMLISELSGRILSDINRHTQQELIDVKNIEATLRAWFGDVWEHLMPDTRTSLISSHMLWESSKNIGGEFDYSGIIICATAALEGELNRIFFSGFQRYMNATAGAPAIGKWPFTLLFIDKFRKLPTGAKHPKCFTMGSLPHILAPQPDRHDNHLLLNEKRAEYFAAIGTSDDAFLDSIYGAEPLLSQCEHIKTNYRNRSAHSGSINLAAAHECHQKIVSSISLIIRLHESIDWSRASAYLPQSIHPENALAVPSAT